ncbi:MAG TPA: LamG domain-containing protein [Kofleriaceae bacterium]|nr:LamG domain-containing protein [Kofleriaceae bacterium]
MVLIRALVAMLLIAGAGAGCGESLFDAHGRGGPDGGGGDDDGAVPTTCPDPCLADAAADFDGSPGGKGGHWRYLDDRRDRTWTAMTLVSGEMTGADPNDRIASCDEQSSAPACQGLPGALRVTSSAAAADPAIEYRSPSTRVIKLSLRALAPAGGTEQRVRLYRNTREDVLFTATARSGELVEHAIVVDALEGDRFLIAIEPIGASEGGEVALHFFINGTSTRFPSTCQLAVPFSVPGSTDEHVDDLCGGEFAVLQGSDTNLVIPSLRNDVFGQMLMAGHVEPGLYYRSAEVLPTSSAKTIQLWFQLDMMLSTPNAWLFSDIDQDNGGGFGIQLDNTSGLKLEASIPTGGSPPTYTSQSVSYPGLNAWHFIRMVHANGMIAICLDGTRLTSVPLAGPSTTVPKYGSYLGRNRWDPSNSFIGALDDVRVFSSALPCEPPN